VGCLGLVWGIFGRGGVTYWGGKSDCERKDRFVSLIRHSERLAPHNLWYQIESPTAVGHTERLYLGIIYLHSMEPRRRKKKSLFGLS
jgi:hypothetical protein